MRKKLARLIKSAGRIQGGAINDKWQSLLPHRERWAIILCGKEMKRILAGSQKCGCLDRADIFGRGGRGAIRILVYSLPALWRCLFHSQQRQVQQIQEPLGPRLAPLEHHL